MTAFTLILTLSALVPSSLAIFAHQWVTALPGLGLGPLYHLRAIRFGIMVLALSAAAGAYWLAPGPGQAAGLAATVVLTLLSDANYAGRILVAVDRPRCVPAAGAGLADEARVLGYAPEGAEARAWPVAVLVPRHLIHDEVGGRPVLASW